MQKLNLFTQSVPWRLLTGLGLDDAQERQLERQLR